MLWWNQCRNSEKGEGLIKCFWMRGRPIEPLALTELLLLNNKEDSVKQFPVLDQVVEVVEQLELLSPSLRRADGKENTMLSNDWDQFLNQKNQQDERNGGQEYVVNLEQDFELERGQFLHEKLSSKNNNEVGNASNKNCRPLRYDGEIMKMMRFDSF